MRKLLMGTSLFLLAPIFSAAQQGETSQIRQRSTPPTTCASNGGYLFWDTTTKELRPCNATNVFGRLVYADFSNAAPATNFLPATDATFDVGSAPKQWKDIYLSGSLIGSSSGPLYIQGVPGSCSVSNASKGRICLSSAGNRFGYSFNGSSYSDLLLRTDVGTNVYVSNTGDGSLNGNLSGVASYTTNSNPNTGYGGAGFYTFYGTAECVAASGCSSATFQVTIHTKDEQGNTVTVSNSSQTYSGRFAMLQFSVAFPSSTLNAITYDITSTSTAYSLYARMRSE